MTPPPLPTHYELSDEQVLFSVLSIVIACVLLLAAGLRIAAGISLAHWWAPLAFIAGMAAADVGSGLVHWAADTWGRDDLPVIGHRLLVPFRVHHVNPDDLLRRRFIDANGDVAFLSIPALAAMLALPLDTIWAGPIGVAGLAFCGVGMWTNQIHQWAHMDAPPAPVRWLQRCRVILGHDAHATHHARPYDVHYCITTGWMNRPLEAIHFFRRAEGVITWLTGARPVGSDRGQTPAVRRLTPV